MGKAEMKGGDDKASFRYERIYNVLKQTSIKVYLENKEQWEKHQKRTQCTDDSTISDIDMDIDNMSSQTSSGLSMGAMSIDSRSSKEKKGKSFFRKLRRKSKR